MRMLGAVVEMKRAHLVAAQGGARIIRTHDVAETVQALRVVAAIGEKR